MLDWFNKLMQSRELANLLPMQVQPGIPALFSSNGIYQIYVPFYHMWQENDLTYISPVLYMIYYNFATLQIISYKHIDNVSVIDKSSYIMGNLPPQSINMISMNIKYVFELLDDMRLILQNRGYIPQDRLNNYNKVLLDALPIKEMKFMYAL